MISLCHLVVTITATSLVQSHIPLPVFHLTYHLQRLIYHIYFIRNYVNLLMEKNWIIPIQLFMNSFHHVGHVRNSV